MSDRLKNQASTIDLPSPQRPDLLRARFESDWRAALEGGPVPHIVHYLGEVQEPVRSVLLRELETIERQYRPRLLSGSEQSPAHSALPEGYRHGEPGASGSLGSTVEFIGPTTAKPSAEHDTEYMSDPEPAISAASGPALADPNATVDRPSSSNTSIISGAGAAPGEHNATLDYQSPNDATAPLEPGSSSASPDDTELCDSARAKRVPTSGPPRVQVANYEILAELGRGAMGVVYKARQRGLNRIVALKMVLAGPHADAIQLARFRSEAEAAAHLQHPSIVQVYEVGEFNGQAYFSLEFVEGQSLAEKIDGKPQPPVEAAEIVHLLSLAMSYAHHQGVIHRDLKPANVLMSSEGVPKIADFGLAKRLEGDSSQTRSGTIMGTPSYMAPEQAWGRVKEIGPLADEYGLGAILYTLLTGRAPFIGTTVLDTLDQVRNKEPIPPSQLQPKVPRDLETICLKALQKELPKRYAGAEELADDLQRFLNGEPIKARPVSVWERSWRWCKRNPRVAALSASIGVLGLVVVAFLVSAGLRASRDREAIAQMRLLAEERLDQATKAITSGDPARARDLLRSSDPLLENSKELADTRAQLRDLYDKVDTYIKFKKKLDDVRVTYWFDEREEKKKARPLCQQLFELYDRLEQPTGDATAGLPPLTAEQRRLFNEDAFEAFLTAALIEHDLNDDSRGEAQTKAGRQAIEWLNRAERILPRTRALYNERAKIWEKLLGDTKAAQADRKQASAIEPTSVVDRYWQGFRNDHAEAVAAQQKGDQQGASKWFHKEMDEYTAILQIRPDHFWSYHNWSLCQFLLGNLNDALVGYSACVHLRPDFAWSYNNRGTIHLRQQSYDQAIQDYTAAVERFKGFKIAYDNRGVAYSGKGQFEAAIEDFNSAIDIDPAYASAYEHRAAANLKQKKTTEAMRDYDKASQIFFSRAGLHYQRGDFAQARDDFTEVIRLRPKEPDPYRSRAFMNLLLKDFDASFKDWEQLSRLQENKPDPYHYMATIYFGRKQYELALESLQNAVAVGPDFIEAHWAIAQLQHVRGKLPEALEVINAVIDKPKLRRPENYNIRGDIHRTMGQLKEAADDYEQVIRMKPATPDTAVNAYVSLALVYQLQKHPDRAQECYDQMVASYPKSAKAYLRRAEFRRHRGLHAAALADADQAEKLDPKSVLPGLVRAGIEAARGDHRPATAAAEKLLAQAPAGNGPVLYCAACAWSLAAGAAAGESKPESAQLAKKYADRAAALLAEALDIGFHDLLYPEHNRMAYDPALAPIRELPKVKALLARGK